MTAGFFKIWVLGMEFRSLYLHSKWTYQLSHLPSSSHIIFFFNGRSLGTRYYDRTSYIHFCTSPRATLFMKDLKCYHSRDSPATHDRDTMGLFPGCVMSPGGLFRNTNVLQRDIAGHQTDDLYNIRSCHLKLECGGEGL